MLLAHPVAGNASDLLRWHGRTGHGDFADGDFRTLRARGGRVRRRRDFTACDRPQDMAGMDFSDVAGSERIGPAIPDDVLREDFMLPLGPVGLSARALDWELAPLRNQIEKNL